MCVILISLRSRPHCRRPIFVIRHWLSCGHSQVFFYEVCSNHTIIDPNKVNGPLGEASATAILQAWVDKLEWTEDRCVEIKDYTPLDFQCLVRFLTLFSFLFLICPAGSDLLRWGKGH
jgi:hypothetical protein